MAENKGMGMLLMVFFLIIIGLAFTQVIGDSVVDSGVTKTANNTLTFSGNGALLGNQNLRDAENIITTGTIAFNNSNGTIGTNNYIVSQNGSFQLKAGAAQLSAQGSNPTNFRLYYTYFSEGYVKDATSRTILPLITLFFVLGLVLLVVWKSGILENWGFGS